MYSLNQKKKINKSQSEEQTASDRTKGLLQNPSSCPLKSDSLPDLVLHLSGLKLLIPPSPWLCPFLPPCPVVIKSCPPSFKLMFILLFLPFVPSFTLTGPAVSPGWSPHLESSSFLPTPAHRWIFQNSEGGQYNRSQLPTYSMPVNLPAHWNLLGTPKSIYSWCFSQSFMDICRAEKRFESTHWHVPSWCGTRPPFAALVYLSSENKCSFCGLFSAIFSSFFVYFVGDFAV